MRRYFSFFVVVLLFQTASYSQFSRSQIPIHRREVRAVWIATVMGLDWPPKSYDPIEQQSSLREIIAKLKDANFNTIFFQVRGRADAMYRSQYEPWSQQLTGTLGQDPGWDPLELIIQEAHAQCMELHVWFNTFLVKSGGPLPANSKPQHILLTHPEWIHQVNGEWWFDPGIPDVRTYNLKVAMDIVRHYDIDGIQFDYIRYPGKPLPDDATYRKYNQGLSRDDWRRENINKFVRAFHDSAVSAKPFLKIGATPIGIYTNTNFAKGQQSYSELYQDSRKWLREGMMDYLAPQVYWTLGTSRGDPDFAAVVRDWSENSYHRHLYIGIGAYKPEVLNQVPQLIDTARSIGIDGTSIFRYDNISDALDIGGRFRTLTNIPPMTWKDSIPPKPPMNIQVQNITDGIFSIRWEPPYRASDGDGAKYFDVYRSHVQTVDINESENLIGIVSGSTYQFIDTISRVTSAKYYYAVSALDKCDNESAPAVESVVVPEIALLVKIYTFDFKLGRNYPNPAESVVFMPYEIKETLPVFLKILDNKNKEIITVVDAMQTPGRYVAAADISKFEDGMYWYLIVAGNFSEKKMFRVDN